MELFNLSTSSLLVKSLYAIAASLIAALLSTTVLSILFQRIIYRKFYKPAYDKSFTPRCSVILPCKGIPKDLEDNLRAYCSLDYPDYELIITVESEIDPAVPVVRAIMEQSSNKRLSLVVAGLATRCSQKNHNMLAAIQHAQDPEVYVFGDADIPPAPQWLRELVLPLSNPKLTATTGFRWLISHKASVGHLTHTNVNIFFLVLFGAVSLLGIGSMMWGGSMAIRRKDFDALNVAEKWARSGVDDISLARVLFNNGKHAMLVPTSITRTDDLIETSRGTITWTTRQIMYLKAYHRLIWACGLGALWLAAALMYLWLPVSMVYSAVSAKSFLEVGGGAPLLFLAGDMLIVLLYPLMGPIPRFYKLFFLQPFLRFTHIVSYWNTMFARTIVWSGIRYTLNRAGDVTKVERLQTP